VATVLVEVTDLHLSVRRPQRRTDRDWMATQRSKLDAVAAVCQSVVVDGRKGADALLIPGDLFHVWDGRAIPRRLDLWVIDFFIGLGIPVLAIPGNHDMKNFRREALRDHPYGILQASGAIRDVCWPECLTVGEDPPVVVTGKEYSPDGPGDWLESLRGGEWADMVRRRARSEDPGKVGIVAMTHCFWGPEESQAFGQVVHGIDRLDRTGIDCMFYGDPHTFDGVVTRRLSGREVSLVGTGAMIRGALSGEEVARKPAIAIAAFWPDGSHKVVTSFLPCREASEVFDVEGKREEISRARMLGGFRGLLGESASSGSAESRLVEILGSDAPPLVRSRCEMHLSAARAAILEGEGDG
jgi:hypothetical protein